MSWSSLIMFPATSITAGLRENRIVTKEGHSQADQEHALKATTTTELEDLLGIASDTVGSLLRFLLLVDKFATRDHDVHALKSQYGTPPDSSDTDYVRMRYPKLDNPENKWLLKRLAQAITARQNFMSSPRRHKQLEIHRHDSPGLPGGLESSGIHTPSISLTDALSSEQKMQSEQPVEPESSRTSRSNFDTLARESSDALSTTDLDITSADGPFNINRLRLPSLDDVKKKSQNSTFFECPLCLVVVSLETEGAWQSHAHYDLKSYVCISKEQCDARLFGSQSAWIDHELRCHRCQWICVICQQGPFVEPEDFSGHLAQSHAEFELPDKALETLKHASQCAVEVMPAMSCPFCDHLGLMLGEPGVARKRGKSSSGAIQKQNTDVPTIDFLRHIATHLEQLAISPFIENILNLAEINKGSDSGEVTSSSTSSSESDMEGNEPFLKGGDFETKEDLADETLGPKIHPGTGIKEPPNRQGESSKFEPPSVPIKTTGVGKKTGQIYLWYCVRYSS